MQKILIITQGLAYPDSNTFRTHTLLTSLNRVGYFVELIVAHDLWVIDYNNEDVIFPKIFDIREMYVHYRYRYLGQWVKNCLSWLYTHTYSIAQIRAHWEDLQAKYHFKIWQELLLGKDGTFSLLFQRTMEKIHQVNPSIIIFTSLEYLPLIQFIRSQYHKPIVVWIPSNWDPNEFSREDIRHELGHWLRRTDGILVHSEYLAKKIREYFELGQKTITVIPDGLLLNNYEPRMILPGHPRIGYYGPIGPKEGLEELVQIWIKIKSDFPECELFLGGDLGIQNRKFLTQLARSIGVSLHKDIHIFPNLPLAEKRTFLKNLTFMLVPRGRDIFNPVVLESIALQVPVLIPEMGSYPEILNRIDGGFLYKTDNLDDCLAKIKLLLHDQNLVEEKGIKGRSAIIEWFSSEKMLEQFLKFIHTLEGAQW